ncbi:terpene synthase [Ganoderma sinense ZZ0214-1]|uniref:Terpene synthase n=1 Tax=Ganoderma sinense ZZ0214-1 TaxID=1077348 RepID=A0A2G8SVA7_9APHY|nr:terpene synthase [Ganoderma sinense ZZ0214-1]
MTILSYLPMPDLLAHWQWKGRLNPQREEVTAEGNAWFRSFTPFNPKSQHAFDLCNFGLFSGLLLPDAPREHLRTGLDLLNLFFIIDEYTDVQPSHVVREMMGACIDAIRNPTKPRPEGEVILAEMVRQFWERALSFATPLGAEWFVEVFTEYLSSVVEVAEWRDRGSPELTLEEYVAIRIKDVGVLPTQAVGGLYFSIPEAVFSNPTVCEAMRIGCELTMIDNDLTSYNREQATGIGGFNLVTVVMHTFELSLDGAVRWLEKRNDELTASFDAHLAAVPSFSPEIDAQLQMYLDHVGNVRRAVWDWSFASGRYFGDRGPEYLRTGLVPLLPRKGQVCEDSIKVFSMEEELAKL